MNRSITRALGAFALASCLAAPTARAKGRFPRAEHLVENPSDPNQLTLSATYGLLHTGDRGKNWYHVCAGRSATTCDWTVDCQVLGACSDGAVASMPAAGTCSSDGGATGAVVLEPAKTGGCGCRAVERADARGAMHAWLLALLGLRRRRTRAA